MKQLLDRILFVLRKMQFCITILLLVSNNINIRIGSDAFHLKSVITKNNKHYSSTSRSRSSILLFSTSEKTSTTTTTNNNDNNEITGLYEIQEELITKRGQFEETLMKNNKYSLLETYKPVIKGLGLGGGFGGGGGGMGGASSKSKSKKNNNKKKKSSSKKNTNKAALKAEGKEYAKTFRDDGVVRMDAVLSDDTAVDLRSFLFDLRLTATEEVTNGSIGGKHRFANVLLRKNRCDLTAPLGPDIIYKALYELLVKSPIGATVSQTLGDDAVLYELSCMISDPGSSRQVIHPDTPCDVDNPILITTFVALQDITLDMGPTCWLPRTHKPEIYKVFQQEDGSPSPKDGLLQSTDYVLGVLPRGSCGMFDSRLLHCGTANNSSVERAVFYVSFRRATCGYPGNPGSIRPELIDRLTLEGLQNELEIYQKKGSSTVLTKLANSLR